MKTKVISVDPDDAVQSAVEKITKHQIGAVFVVSEGKLLGQISREDVLAHVLPSEQEFYDDLVHNLDFDHIQHRARELADLPARELMSPVNLTVEPDTPVMKVASWMSLRKIHRVAVVDDDGQLCGVASQGDIFDQVMKAEMAAAVPS